MHPKQWLTPREAILIHLLREYAGFTDPIDDLTDIDALWDKYKEAEDADYDLSDCLNGFRHGQEDSLIRCETSRHLETKSVAAKLSDGTWVGWTYYYGGGKHAQPETIDWLEDAYWVDVTEEQKMVTVYNFKKAE